MSLEGILTTVSGHSHFKVSRSMKRRLRRVVRSTTEKNKEEISKAVFYWLRGHLEYKKGFFIKPIYGSARKTLRRGHGICLDQSLLYVSLLREMGIAGCVSYVGGDHAVAVISPDRRVIVDVAEGRYDTEIVSHRPMSDMQVVADIKQWNKGIRISNAFKKVLFGVGLSVAINLSQPYWYTSKIKKFQETTASYVSTGYDYTRKYVNKLYSFL